MRSLDGLDYNLLAFLPMCAIDMLHAQFWLQLLALSKDAGILSSFWLQGVEGRDTKLTKALSLFHWSYPRTD